MVEKEETSEINKIANNELKEIVADKIVKEEIDDEGNVVESKENKDTNNINNGESKDNGLLARESWEELSLKENIIKGLLDMNFVRPSKIQSISFEMTKNNPEKHLVAQSQNGSGKTGAFAIPTISKIDESLDEIQAVVFAHNREMINQHYKVLTSIAKYTKVTIGEFKKDTETKKHHIVIITPGSFKTLFLERKKFSLNHLKVLVLDEADYLIKTDTTRVVLQLTFNVINKSKSNVQVLFFSATFEKEEYKFITSFFKGKLLAIKTEKAKLTLETVRQMYIKCNNNKDQIIEDYLKANINTERVVIFVNSRNNAIKLQERLISKGYKVYILMGGDMNLDNRDETVKRFKLGQIQILITTDLLSRGFDERLVKLIINYDLPLTKDEKTGQIVPAMDTYLHRIGRTGRFGDKGIGLTLVDEKYEKNIKEIEKFYESNIEEIKSIDSLIAEFKKLLNEY